MQVCLERYFVVSAYNDLFPLGPDTTDYRRVGEGQEGSLISSQKLGDHDVLVIKEEALRLMADEAFVTSTITCGQATYNNCAIFWMTKRQVPMTVSWRLST